MCGSEEELQENPRCYWKRILRKERKKMVKPSSADDAYTWGHRLQNRRKPTMKEQKTIKYKNVYIRTWKKDIILLPLLLMLLMLIFESLQDSKKQKQKSQNRIMYLYIGIIIICVSPKKMTLKNLNSKKLRLPLF